MRPPLRFITCGSVDDGKSTLIGRLLYDTGQVPEDGLAMLKRDSARYGTQGQALDFALLVDGLQVEREQGITVDCAYRYFATAQRRFIVADVPGHEQYTRNMATGASTAAAAVLVLDARHGSLVQTRRHCRIVGLMGVRQLVVAINKMDLVDWREADFARIAGEFTTFARTLGFAGITAIPVSALAGDNLARPGLHSPWYGGPTLLACLDAMEAESASPVPGFRMPVQYVNRPDAGFRGYCGRLVDGSVVVGERVWIAPSGIETSVRSIVVYGAEPAQAAAGSSVTLTLADEVDVARGDVIAAAAAPVEVADQFEAQVIWMSDQPLLPGRAYRLKLHSLEAGVTVTAIKHLVDIDSGTHLAAREVGKNAIAVVNLSIDRPVPFDRYVKSRRLGAFIFIDRSTCETAGAGMINFALRRSSNIHWQAQSLDRGARAGLKGQRPSCIWLTGLSGAGKSTIANLLEVRLHAAGRHTYLLDGDNVRHGLNRDLGFTEAARVENIRRVAEVARLMVDAGLIVIVSFISPYRAEREFARSLFAAGEFFEVHVDAPLAECERRDPKGLYAKARRGELANFTGIDSVYEAPQQADARLDTDRDDADACVDALMTKLRL